MKRLVPGSRPLLFDRLAAIDGGDSSGGRGAADCDEEALRASIGRELADLLRTRAPVALAVLEGRRRSAIDYGIPDLSAFPVGEHDANLRLTAQVRNAILAYEPRLHEPQITIQRGGKRAEDITIAISGLLMVERTRVPVRFEMPLVESARGAANGD